MNCIKEYSNPSRETHLYIGKQTIGTPGIDAKMLLELILL